jgi:NTP pyrophosphatase (non-canonical NTP hydrolase)
MPSFDNVNLSPGLKLSGTIRNCQKAIVDWKDSFLTGTIHEPSVKTNCFRVLEEAAESCQSGGMTEEECHRQIAYTYSRPKGELAQELAQTFVNLAYLADSAGIDLETEVLKEISRIDTPEMKQKIFDKQQFKKDNGLV